MVWFRRRLQMLLKHIYIHTLRKPQTDDHIATQEHLVVHCLGVFTAILEISVRRADYYPPQNLNIATRFDSNWHPRHSRHHTRRVMMVFPFYVWLSSLLGNGSLVCGQS
jgi:hypothetical protein